MTPETDSPVGWSDRGDRGDRGDPVDSADRLVEALRAAVGAGNVLVDADGRAPYETDWTGRFHGPARAVVRPGTTAEVVAVVRACVDAGAAIVPQGGNTGLVGASVPRGASMSGAPDGARRPQVVLSTQRLAEIGPVDADVGEVVVGAGATLAAVQAAARAAGWDVGVDFAARDRATIGGLVSTNAGGEHVLRYGTMADQVIGVEAVLADGSVVGRVPALRKDNTGYRWPGVLAGAEGTLGVLTRVHLGLVPELPDRVVALAALADLTSALRLSGVLRRDLTSLLALEVCFADGVELVCEHGGIPRPFTTAHPLYVLVECGGRRGEGPAMLAALGEVLATRAEVLDSVMVEDSAGRARLWAYREGHAEAINVAPGAPPHKLDVTLGFDRLVEFADRVRALVGEVAPGARTILFGHLGDGNLHVNVLGLGPYDETVDDAVMELAASLGGSISAEHGIGVARRSQLGLARSASDIAAMRALKYALDPTSTLNPGVLLPD